MGVNLSLAIPLRRRSACCTAMGTAFGAGGETKALTQDDERERSSERLLKK